MDWTEEMTIMLIERIKDYPCLWDTFHEDKKNKTKIAHAYKSLARELNTNIANLRKRKEMIFQTYRNYKRKVARSRLNALTDDDVYHPSWTPYPFLDAFLHPVYTPKGPIYSMKEEKRLHMEELQTLDEGDDDDEFIEADHLELAGHNSEPSSSKVRKIERTSDTSYANTVLKQVIEINKRVLHKTASCYDSTASQSRDECSIYGELVALRLRKLDEAQRQFAMYEMDNILYNITLGMSLARPESTLYPNRYVNNQMENGSLEHHSPGEFQEPLSLEIPLSPITPKVTLDIGNHLDEPAKD